MSSPEITNTISSHLLTMGISSAVNGLGAVTISSPVGIVGGVCFGAISYAIKLPISSFCDAFHLNKNSSSLASRILGLVLIIFGSYIPAWHIMHLAGYTFNFIQATWLAAVGLGFSALSEKIIKQIGLNHMLN